MKTPRKRCGFRGRNLLPCISLETHGFASEIGRAGMEGLRRIYLFSTKGGPVVFAGAGIKLARKKPLVMVNYCPFCGRGIAIKTKKK